MSGQSSKPSQPAKITNDEPELDPTQSRKQRSKQKANRNVKGKGKKTQ